jgi:hypothetical protein
VSATSRAPPHPGAPCVVDPDSSSKQPVQSASQATNLYWAGAWGCGNELCELMVVGLEKTRVHERLLVWSVS